MSAAFPELKGQMIGLTVLAVPFLWFFDWAVWAWGLAAFFYVLVLCAWWAEVIKVHRTDQATERAVEQTDSEEGSAYDTETQLRAKSRQWTEDDEVRSCRQDLDVIWTGKKMVTFTYRDRGWREPVEVNATATEVLCRPFGEDWDTYMKATPVGEAPRYYCLRYIKGRRLTDADSGKAGTLRQILSVKRRVY